MICFEQTAHPDFFSPHTYWERYIGVRNTAFTLSFSHTHTFSLWIKTQSNITLHSLCMLYWSGFLYGYLKMGPLVSVLGLEGHCPFPSHPTHHRKIISVNHFWKYKSESAPSYRCTSSGVTKLEIVDIFIFSSVLYIFVWFSFNCLGIRVCLTFRNRGDWSLLLTRINHMSN